MKVFDKSNVCEGSTINAEATAFINKLMTCDNVTIDDMNVTDEKVVIEYHINDIHAEEE
jgi:hypothetical protein